MKKFLNWLLFIFTFGGPMAEEAIKENTFNPRNSEETIDRIKMIKWD